jgi:hypothetical protein
MTTSDGNRAQWQGVTMVHNNPEVCRRNIERRERKKRTGSIAVRPGQCGNRGGKLVKIVIKLHNKAGVVIATGDRPDKKINVVLAESTPGALEGLGILEGLDGYNVEFDEPLLVTGITIEPINEQGDTHA